MDESSTDWGVRWVRRDGRSWDAGGCSEQGARAVVAAHVKPSKDRDPHASLVVCRPVGVWSEAGEQR